MAKVEVEIPYLALNAFVRKQEHIENKSTKLSTRPSWKIVFKKAI